MLDKSELIHHTYIDLLRVNHNIFTLKDIVEYLNANPQIQKVELLDAIVVGGDATLLRRLTSVYSVVITGTSINDSVISSIVKNSRIKLLYLDFIALPISAITSISSSAAILKLYASHCDIDDNCAYELSANNTFKELYISDNRITDKGLSAFLANSNIVKLDVSNNPIKSFDVIEQLKKTKHVVHDGIGGGLSNLRS